MTAYLTPKEVSERWQCTPDHVARLCKSGALVAMRLEGRGWRIKPEAVADYERRQTTARTDVTPNVAMRHEKSHPPALALDGDYLMVVPGPVPWRSEVIEAPARPAGRRGGSARMKKAASVRS